MFGELGLAAVGGGEDCTVGLCGHLWSGGLGSYGARRSFEGREMAEQDTWRAGVSHGRRGSMQQRRHVGNSTSASVLVARAVRSEASVVLAVRARRRRGSGRAREDSRNGGERAMVRVGSW